jgi:superfamily II DNA or RNA helicase
MQSAASPPVPAKERDDYWTLVTYFNSLRELGGAHVLMLDDVPKSISEYANRWAEPPREILEPSELTSRLSQAEIPEVLRRLQENQQSNRAEDVLLCTNMISVGVDVPRLALMIVNGQPKSVAEYIQATSRVGRDVAPGLVVTIFNNNKPRDRSRFETFTNWHNTLYRDVEPTSVTPFAARALDKALRAVIVALVRHLVPTMGTNPVLGSARRGEVEQLASVFVERAEEIDPVEKDEVRRRISVILDEWEKREGIMYYWNEFKPQQTLMMSAERSAARRAAHRPESNVWPAPNSMRDVEPETHFRLLK